jgi:outer membrane lipoprotein-sorting protein
MSEAPRIPSPDDLLARAEEALRRAPVPDGPSEEAVARVLTALAQASTGPRVPRGRGRKPIRWLGRVAALLVLSAGLFYAAGSWLLRPGLAFGEVTRKLHDARTLSYRMTMELPGAPEPESLRLLFMEPGLIRAEGRRGMVVIIDANKDVLLALDPQTKTAVLIEGADADAGRDPAGASAAQMVARLRKLVEKRGIATGTKQIGPVLAQGFRVEDRGQEMTVWGDPKTKLPVLVESKVQLGDLEGRVTLSDFEIDPMLDPALFRLEPPQGYAVQKAAQEPMSPEEAVARLLGVYAENSGGTFPARLDDWAAYDKMLRNKHFKGPADADYLRLTRTLTRVVAFVQDHKHSYGYQAAGVKLGDADKVVFWYQPRGAATYRAVYGDLHIADVAPDRLPTKHKE